MRRRVNAAPSRSASSRSRCSRARAPALPRRPALRRRGRVRRRHPLLGQRLPPLPGRLGRSAAGPAPPVPRGVRPVRAARVGHPCACHRLGGRPRKRSGAARRPRRRSPHGPRRRALVAVLSVGPRIEGFAANGELLAALPAAAALLVFAIWLEPQARCAPARGRCARRVRAARQAVGVRRRRGDRDLARARGLARLAAPATGAAGDRPGRDRRRCPRALRSLHGAATGFHRWWFAVADYRLSVESVATGSLSHRADLLWSAFGRHGRASSR